MSETKRMSTRMLLICGAIAGPLFIFIWFVTGSMRANYDPMRHPISALSLGEFGWTQIANFIITGILTLVLAFGLRRMQKSRDIPARLPLLIAVAGIGFVGTGFFVTDPMNGYPPETPLIILPPTLVGFLHLLFASFIFSLPVASFVLARQFATEGEHIWVVYSVMTAIAFIVIYLIGMAGFLQVEGLSGYAGLYQRISVIIGLTWMTLVPIYLMKTSGRETTNRQ